MTGAATASSRSRWPLLLVALIIAVTVGWALLHHHTPGATQSATSLDPQISAGAGAQTSPPGVISPTGAAGTVITTPSPTSTSSTVTPRAPDPPATVAAQIAQRYLSTPPADRAEACKNSAGDNVCTADLAATLAARWVGGGGTAAPGPVTIVGTVASDVTATAIGYEIRANVAGQLVAVLVRVVQTADGHWLASTLRETS
jgi:hypothetical protein